MNRLASKFRGCLVGALMGDCFGAPFEYEETAPAKPVLKRFFLKMEEKGSSASLPFKAYTDDTAMTFSVAESLIEKEGFDAKNIAEKFVSSYYAEPRRGYGGNVVHVFEKLKHANCVDPFGPASLQFGGSGSYGNGAAMRVAPLALLLHDNQEQRIEKVTELSRITHTHPNAINGAILQSECIVMALNADPACPLESDKFTKTLSEFMKLKEERSEGQASYQSKFELMRFLLKLDKDDNVSKKYRRKEPTFDDYVRKDLGVDVAALHSVPTAVFTALYAQDSKESTTTDGNPLTSALKYAISLGGDTDTVASMAGAIIGAHRGIEAIPTAIMEHCEGVDRAIKLADQLATLYGKKKN